MGITNNGGYQGGESAKADTGGAIGVTANTNSGGSVGCNAISYRGGAIGYSSQTEDGGAAGLEAFSNLGGAAGSYATTKNGGAVGESAKSANGGAVGESAETASGGAAGHSAVSFSGGAVGYKAMTSTGFSGGNMARAVDTQGNGIDAIQLGTGTNSNEKTLQVYDYPMMDANGNIPSERIPQLAGKVDAVVGKGLSTNDYTVADKTKLAGIEAGAQVNTVASVAGKTGTVVLSKSDVGLGKVDNTSDMEKPVSTAVKDAIKAVSLHGTANGYPITVNDHQAGAELIGCKIYGNTVQNGTPTPESPVAVESVGELVTEGEHAGKYKVAILCGENTADIYLNAPLRKIRDYADYIDYKNQRVVRRVGTHAFTGSEYKFLEGSLVSSPDFSRFYAYKPDDMMRQDWRRGYGLCNKFPYLHIDEGDYNTVTREGIGFGYGNNLIQHVISKSRCADVNEYQALLAEWYAAGDPLIVYYPLAQEVTENITISALTAPASETMTIAADTTVAPSKIEVEYYQDINKKITALEDAIKSLQNA